MPYAIGSLMCPSGPLMCCCCCSLHSWVHAPPATSPAAAAAAAGGPSEYPLLGRLVGFGSFGRVYEGGMGCNSVCSVWYPRGSVTCGVHSRAMICRLLCKTLERATLHVSMVHCTSSAQPNCDGVPPHVTQRAPQEPPQRCCCSAAALGTPPRQHFTCSRCVQQRQLAASGAVGWACSWCTPALCDPR
jgi:hypothetical protein